MNTGLPQDLEAPIALLEHPRLPERVRTEIDALLATDANLALAFARGLLLGVELTVVEIADLQARPLTVKTVEVTDGELGVSIGGANV